MMRRALVLAALLCASAVSAQDRAPARSGQSPEAGRPFIRNFEPEEFGGSNGQTWAILEDRRGVMYFGASNGVFEFDGATWRVIKIPGQSNSTVRSLAMGADGRIYAGCVGDFGYLAPDAQGQTRFVSLLAKVPAENRVFSDVWRTYVTPEGVYFQTEFQLFRWADDQIRIWKAPVSFGRAAYVNGRLLLPQPGVGLTELAGETFRPLPGTGRFGNEVYNLILPYDDRQMLIGTRADGLFLYDGSEAHPFPTEVDDLIKHKVLYRGAVLQDGSFGLTTTSGGVAIIDRAGRRVQVLDQSVGLISDQAYFIAAPRSGGLWIGTTNGISYVDTPSPSTFFDKADNSRLQAADMVRFGGRLYMATSQGVLYLQPASAASPRARWVSVGGIENQCWEFLTVKDESGLPKELFVAASDGLFRIEGDRATGLVRSVGRSYNVSTLFRSKVDPDRIWVGLFNGLTSVRRHGAAWEDEGPIADLPDQVRSLAEDADGSVWAGTQNSGLLRVRVAPGTAKVDGHRAAQIERFGAKEGLLGGGVGVGSGEDGIFFFSGSEKRVDISQYDAASKRFVRDTRFNVVSEDVEHSIRTVQRMEDGTLFVNFGRETAIMRRKPDGTYSVDRDTFSDFFGGLYTTYLDRDGVIWTQRRRDLVRFDPSRRVVRTGGFPALVRRVTVNSSAVAYGGAGAVGDGPRLAPSERNLRFEFAAPLAPGSVIEYQSRLDGLDRDWSAWTSEARRDYTNLPFGAYRFRVHARDVRGRVSEEGVYAFTILPPWYRTWWAYGLYVALLGLAAFGFDRVQRARLTKKERDRAAFSEARLRAESAEALAKSESEGKKNVELLSQIGREITSTLDFETIFGKLYDSVNQLADADVFGVGLYHPDRHQIEYRLAIEAGKRYAPYTRDTSDPDQFPVWCIEHRQPIFINDVRAEWSKYLKRFDDQVRPLEDGTMSSVPQSLIYLPLVSKDRVLGIITIQSFEKDAYTDSHLALMQSLASYTAIALDNAAAYRQLNEQEHEMRRLFDEAERARATAEEADQAKSAFLSTVSHELRTPLTSVLGFAKIIKKRLDERIFPLVKSDDRRVLQTVQQIEENLKVVVSEGERLTKLIDDVLDLAKIEAGKLEWNMEAVDVAEVVEHATAATASLFEQKGLRLVKEVAPELPALTGDRDRLVQVVINLISNAVKFTDAGSITCRAERSGGEIVVSIVDTGMGIAPADQPKVFERFKQVGDTLTDKPKGTGLGLPICREIVEHHGGRIWVESTLGQGSTFSFALPISGAAADAPAGGPVELAALIRQLRDQVVVTTPKTPARQPRILIVDDEPNIRELLSQEFTEAGYLVGTAANGREAIAEVRRERPDLVVLDVMMPEMNGFDVAAVLKNDPATLDIPIVILSIVQDKERGFRLGVDRYLTKPIDTELLFREVGTLIEQKKSKKRVLVVDEDASTVKTLTDVLKARGYSVAEARSSELVERARAVQPDIIMLSSIASTGADVVRTLRFERGLENVLFLVYQ